jgi:hypothetical protein
MLPSQSSNVAMYLVRSARARACAQRATLKSERAFYERMEQRWMNLAASTASLERVDLFAHTLQSTSVPHDTCERCSGLMALEAVEATTRWEIYTLRCRDCGVSERRTVMHYTLHDIEGNDRDRGTLATAAATHTT